MSKTWLITGSSRGLGRALAEAVLDVGDDLVATARNTSGLEDLSERYAAQVILRSLDVTDFAAAEAAVNAAASADWTSWRTWPASQAARHRFGLDPNRLSAASALASISPAFWLFLHLPGFRPKQ
jgi:NAD(P)-dependent dehydrogenase (short-subunit alcohol dehydrogenase family)